MPRRLKPYGPGDGRPTAEYFYPARLRKTRIRTGLSQVEASRRAGVGEHTIRDWEAGRTRPSRLLLHKVLRVLRTPLVEVLVPPDDSCDCGEERFALRDANDRGVLTTYWFCPTCDVRDP